MISGKVRPVKQLVHLPENRATMPALTCGHRQIHMQLSASMVISLTSEGSGGLSFSAFGGCMVTTAVRTKQPRSLKL